jgi:hypothetical protein
VGNDAVPEFHAQTLPAGTAPSDRTFQPNTQSLIPGQYQDPNIASDVQTRGDETIPGATSRDVHKGIGQPIYGQSSRQLRHGEKKGRHKHGLVGVGADPRNPVRERALDIDVPKGTRGKSGVNRQNVPGAEERLPETAETVAAERD